MSRLPDSAAATDHDLILRALSRAGDKSLRELEQEFGVARSSIRKWRHALATGTPLPELNVQGREKLRVYLAGGVAVESADYWRGALASAERQVRAAADAMAAVLSGATAAPAADPTQAAAAATAAMAAPATPRSRSVGTHRRRA